MPIPENDLWTSDDSREALLEGWDIFDCEGSDNGPFQIQALEEPGLLPELGYTEKKFASDEDAWRHVFEQHTQLHEKARIFIQRNNPIEYAAIEKWSRDNPERRVVVTIIVDAIVADPTWTDDDLIDNLVYYVTTAFDEAESENPGGPYKLDSTSIGIRINQTEEQS